ncbi:hypothetical protein E5288_WYG007402 [Bos mutus]|uniref:Uncharacterized protein n=1 Tax=Bos mutus TaxID=72004 RepID=A0A6B0SCE6_9CETA|nr:hypothetical protein [Bos mutus]
MAAAAALRDTPQTLKPRTCSGARSSDPGIQDSDAVVNMYFTITSLISGYWHGVEDKEAPSEQSICIGVSQIRTLKVDSSPHKGQPFEMCGPVLRDILHFPEHQETHLGQKPYTCGNRFYISANLQQYQEQHIGEIPIRSSVDTALIINSCTTHVSGKPTVYGEIGNDFLVNVGFFHHTEEKLNNSNEYAPVTVTVQYQRAQMLEHLECSAKGRCHRGR